ncbi:hypothetical protein N7410_28870 [Klebsiella pasteurii]|uniref:hypothetical protein n=1 Tax=Klebsiella pasteurii TaxID=2587529 RepID=UPI002447A7BB|nr:hypothetical protein [Klebsiella pasteurii]MDH0315286.1 hypothetical protein [Klebsiella pasteurii]
MSKFEGITVVHLDSSDYVGEALSPAAEREIDTADIVIDGNKVVKNRVCGMGLTRTAETLKTFKGLSLESVDAFQNIAAMNEVGLLLMAAGDENSDLGDCVIALARDYAAAAHAYALEEKK